MLKTLSAVQAVDLELDALDDERGQTPQALIDARARERQLQRELTQRETEAGDLRSRVAQAELDLKALQERRKDAADFALRAGTGKEASQYQNQELQFATRAQELEEDTLPLMEELEGREQQVEELRALVAELTPELEALASEEEARLQAIDEQAAELRRRRDELAGSIDAGLLKQYEQVRRARRGLGLVSVVASQRCGGCNVRLPIFVVQKVRKGDDVTRCPSCGRILMNDDDQG
jgi:uncharacterized protein